MNALDRLTQDVASCTRLPPDQIPGALSRILSLDPTSNTLMVQINAMPLQPRIECKGFFNDEYMAFNNVVTLFARLCNQMDPWSVLTSFDLYAQLLQDEAVAFSNAQRGHYMIPTIKDTINTVLPMATRIDATMFERESMPWPRLTHMASILLRVFNNIRANDPSETKKSIILFIGNKLCLVYNRIGNPLLCRNIYSNMNNLGLDWRKYLRNEQLQYRYYLARFYLIKHQLVDCYQHLLWCLHNCPVGIRDLANVSKILKYLLPVAIIIGKCPNIDYICHTLYSGPGSIPRFMSTYRAIIRSIKQGSLWNFHQVLSANYSELKNSELLLLLVNKCHILIVRNLLRKTWFCLDQPNKFEFAEIKTALRLSIGQDNTANKPVAYNSYLQLLDNAGVHNLLISLIDEDLLRGKIFPMLETVALSRTNVFPKVDFVNFTKFGNGIEGTLNGNDKWMATS